MEILLTHIAGVKLLILALMGWIYSRCGRGWKWGNWRVKRRVILPLLLCLVWVCSALIKGRIEPKLLIAIVLSFPLYYLCMSVGYGASSLIEKIIRRGFYGLCLGIAPLILVWFLGEWDMLYNNIILCMVSSLFLGITNPTDASSEEAILGALQFIIPIMII